MKSFQFPVFSMVGKFRSRKRSLGNFTDFLIFRRLITLMLPLLSIVILFMLGNWCFPLPKARLHPPLSQIVLDRNGEWLRAFLADDGMWRFSRQPSAVSEETFLNETLLTDRQLLMTDGYSTDNYLLHQAILTSEDRWFYYHYGINPVSIATAPL